MHVFQPFAIEKIEISPFTAQGESGVGITVEADGKINCTSSLYVSFGKLWGKDVVFVFIREESYTKELMDKSDFFSVTFFEDKYKTSVKFLKTISGREEDKIKDIGLTINKKIDIPYIDEGNLVLLCNKIASIPMDYDADDCFISKSILKKHYEVKGKHHIIIGEILESMAR